MAITDLTGYTWVGNETLSSVGSPFAWMSSSPDQLSLNFTSNGNNYTAFGNWYISKPIRAQFIGYDSTNAYDYVVGWMDEAYKTILITGGSDVTNTTLITWLENNGTLTPPEPEPEVTKIYKGNIVRDDIVKIYKGNELIYEAVQPQPEGYSVTVTNVYSGSMKANYFNVGFGYDDGNSISYAGFPKFISSPSNPNDTVSFNTGDYVNSQGIAPNIIVVGVFMVIIGAIENVKTTGDASFISLGDPSEYSQQSGYTSFGYHVMGIYKIEGDGTVEFNGWDDD